MKCPHPEMIEAIALARFDFAVVDMEHTPLGPRDLYPLVLAAERHRLSLVVRIPQKQDAYFKWCRDLNVARIQVPHIETVQDALYSIQNSYFSPQGERGLCRFVRAANFSALPKDEYIRQANASNRLMLQIEGQRAIANLPDILSVLPPEASIFIGPYDLSQSLGIPGQIWDSKVVLAMEGIINQCHCKGVKVGTFTDSPEGLAFWSRRGLDYLEYASDLHLFIASSQVLVSAHKENKIPTS